MLGSMNTPLMHEYDVVVVGGGAAASRPHLSCPAPGASRRGRRGQPRNAPAAHMHGFLGSDGLPPSTLLTVGRDEIARYGAHSRPRHGHRHRPPRHRRARLRLHRRRLSRWPAVRSPAGTGHHRTARRTARHSRSSRALGPRPPALSVLPRLRGPRPGARRARRHAWRGRARPPDSPVVRRRRLLHPWRSAGRGRSRCARGSSHRRRRRSGRPARRRRRPPDRGSARVTAGSFPATRCLSGRA